MPIKGAPFVVSQGFPLMVGFSLWLLCLGRKRRNK